MNKKVIAMMTAMVMLFGVVVGGTIAWLTDTAETVTNTFTVGDINIKLDEAPVDADGKTTTGARGQANEYKLIPGSTYDKDPKVTVLANSEKCYVYVKITETNNESEIIDWDLNTNNWIELTGVENVYVYSTDGSTAAIVETRTTDQMLSSIILNDKIKISDDVDKETVKALDGIVNTDEYASSEEASEAAEEEEAARPKLVFDAYAVQVANIGTNAAVDDALEAWTKAFGTTATTTP